MAQEKKVQANNYAELARYAEVSRSHISKIMRGEIWPSLVVAERIARAKKVSLDRLYKELAAMHIISHNDAPRRKGMGNAKEK